MLEWSKFDYSVTVMETAIEDIHGVDIDYMFLSVLPPDSNSLNFETTYVSETCQWTFPGDRQVLLPKGQKSM